MIKNNPQKLEDFWPKIRSIWEWRSTEASLHNHSSDYDEEIREFSNLPILAPPFETIQTMWPLLEGLLPAPEKGGSFYT